MSVDAPRVFDAVDTLRSAVARWKRHGARVALVPTMGALHAGHMALIARAQALADRTIVSIFVNPTQFAPNEDFLRYPRTFEADVAKLRDVGCDAVWAPAAETMYPDGFATRIEMDGPALGLETDFRPHFFAGVSIVCCKLFTQTQADVAVFGEKDYQQLAVMRRLVADLDLPIEIVGHETIREADGLALSSRNAYLSKDHRAIAPRMVEILETAVAQLREGQSIADCEAKAVAALAAAGFDHVDYVAIRDARTLARCSGPTAETGQPLRILAAAWLGETRLIDNLDASLEPAPSAAD